MKHVQLTDLNCNIDTGICEIPMDQSGKAEAKTVKPVKLLYFTDPICSSCWGIEPQLRKLKQEYGDYFNIEYRMGGLLKSWNEYGGKDVSGPASVAQHWEEAGAHYSMPIDGDVWKEDPLHSSYPPSVAVKAAQIQGPESGYRFLRRVKEMVFMEKKNITRIEHLIQAAVDAGLDVEQFEQDLELSAPGLFEDDLAMAKEWGARGFPTIYFIDGDDNRFKVYGSKPYAAYEEALMKLLPAMTEKKKPQSYDTIFDGIKTATLTEFAVFYNLAPELAEKILQEMESEKKLIRFTSKAGVLWKWIKN